MKPAWERLGQDLFLENPDYNLEQPSNCDSAFIHVENTVPDRVSQATHIFLKVHWHQYS